ncbi:hypothetical protein SLEP1_g13296 [Rubroshorea leprosula]|uniref:Uncharacterized protein n=1 Tax=Rubroshorea leprosula TaxID=152421 RepID=A0AAV5IPS9_9ROSI|nr:hypothetical protein SLEP1_g13296 [Rubroshorea leprosula]
MVVMSTQDSGDGRKTATQQFVPELPGKSMCNRKVSPRACRRTRLPLLKIDPRPLLLGLSQQM